VLLLSVRPRFAEAIMAGTKTVELRRTRMHAPVGSRVVLYSSSPVRAVIGTAVLDRIESEHPAALWLGVGAGSAVTKSEFDAYFHGADSGHGLHLREVDALTTPVSLQDLRRRVGVEPPQSFRYLSAPQTRALLAENTGSPPRPGRASLAARVERTLRLAVRMGVRPLTRLLP
jgi:predicted transcriptional regulator